MSKCFYSENSLSTDSNLYIKYNPGFNDKIDLDNSLSSYFYSVSESKNNIELSSIGINSSNQVLKGKWSKEEDEKLKNAVDYLGARNWKIVAQQVDGRTPIQCLHRWSKILQPGLVKGPWTVEEDRKLLNWVKKEGAVKWSACAQFIKGRSGKQCRERYFNTLIPNLKKGNWTSEEDFILFKLYNQYGSQWSKINKYFSGRTENSIKNRFYSTLRRIATEKKKFMKKLEVEEINSISCFKELAQFIPNALKEKTINLLNKKKSKKTSIKDKTMTGFYNNINNQEEIIKSDLFNSHDCINNNTINNNLNKYSFNKFSEPKYSQNYEGIYPFFNEEYNFYNNLPLNKIENKLEEFNIFSNTSNENNTVVIDNQIDKFINNIFEHNNDHNDSNDNTIFRKTCIGCEHFDQNIFYNNEEYSTISSLIKQIDDLDNILQETKSELLKNIFIKKN